MGSAQEAVGERSTNQSVEMTNIDIFYFDLACFMAERDEPAVPPE